MVLDETFSKIGASGNIEDYWCINGKKVVPPTGRTYTISSQLKCGSTYLVFFNTAMEVEPLFITAVYPKEIPYTYLLCDA
jgi:hypothetical protein